MQRELHFYLGNLELKNDGGGGMQPPFSLIALSQNVVHSVLGINKTKSLKIWLLVGF